MSDIPHGQKWVSNTPDPPTTQAHAPEVPAANSWAALNATIGFKDAQLEAERALADDLADVLNELLAGFWAVRDYDEVKRVLARYREARER